MPNGLSVAALTLATAVCEFVERHGRRRQDAEAAGVGGRRHQPRTRHPAHPGLHHRMLDADQLGQRRAQFASSPYFLVPQRLRVDHLTDQLQFVVRSAAESVPASSRPCTSNDVFSRTSSGVIPGCSDTARI